MLARQDKIKTLILSTDYTNLLYPSHKYFNHTKK